MFKTVEAPTANPVIAELLQVPLYINSGSPMLGIPDIRLAEERTAMM
jgi:hypothetical protein